MFFEWHERPSAVFVEGRLIDDDVHLPIWEIIWSHVSMDKQLYICHRSFGDTGEYLMAWRRKSDCEVTIKMLKPRFCVLQAGRCDDDAVFKTCCPGKCSYHSAYDIDACEQRAFLIVVTCWCLPQTCSNVTWRMSSVVGQTARSAWRQYRSKVRLCVWLWWLVLTLIWLSRLACR